MTFRFTIRDVLWLTVVLAVVAGWCVDNRDKWSVIHKLDGYGNYVPNHPPMPWNLWLRSKLNPYDQTGRIQFMAGLMLGFAAYGVGSRLIRWTKSPPRFDRREAPHAPTSPSH